MSFCGGDLLHSGDPIVVGVRYIITAFCYVDLVDEFSNDQIIPNFENDLESQSRKQSKLKDLLTGDVAKATVSQTFSFGFDL